MFTIIAGINNCGALGRHNSLLWSSKLDMKHFKETTLGSSVIMGRKTFESLKRPLKDREVIVISRSIREEDGVKFVNSFESALDIATKPIYIIGGEQIFRIALNHSESKNLILSFIDNDSNGDCYFPLINNRDKEWKTIKEESFNIKNDPLYKIVWAERIQHG